MIFQQPVLATVMALAEPAITDDPLRALAAFFEGTADLLGWHAAAERGGEVYRCFAGDGALGEGRGGGRGEVFPGVDEAEGGFGERGADGEEGC